MVFVLLLLGGLFSLLTLEDQLPTGGDVGRHNALDKILGWALLEGKLPLGETALLVSGRISFELVQKALAAGIPLIAGIGAPSSLAVACASAGGQTLVGFLRREKFNLYCGAERISAGPQSPP